MDFIRTRSLLNDYYLEKTAGSAQWMGWSTRTTVDDRDLRDFKRWLSDINADPSKVQRFPRKGYVKLRDGAMIPLQRSGPDIIAPTILAPGMRVHSGSERISYDFVKELGGPTRALKVPGVKRVGSPPKFKQAPKTRVKGLRSRFGFRATQASNPSKDKFLKIVRQVKNLGELQTPPQGSVRLPVGNNPPVTEMVGMSKQRASKFVRAVRRFAAKGWL